MYLTYQTQHLTVFANRATTGYYLILIDLNFKLIQGDAQDMMLSKRSTEVLVGNGAMYIKYTHEIHNRVIFFSLSPQETNS